MATRTGQTKREMPPAPAAPAKKTTLEERIRAHRYHTINIAPAENMPLYVPVNVHGTDERGEFVKKGTPLDMQFLIQRGVDAPNIPYPVVLVLVNSIETKYKQKKRGGEKGGMIMVPYREKSYPFHIVDSYDNKLPAGAPGAVAVEEDTAPPPI